MHKQKYSMASMTAEMEISHEMGYRDIIYFPKSQAYVTVNSDMDVISR